MRVIHLSYARVSEYCDPDKWLDRLSFLTVLLQKTAAYAEVQSIHLINFSGVLERNGIKYHFMKKRRWQVLFPISIHRYLKSLRPDVIVVHGLIFPWQIIILRWQVGRHVIIIGQHHAERPWRDFRKYFQRWADRYIRAYLFASHEQGLEWVEQGTISNAKKIKEIMGTSSPFYPIERDNAKSVTKTSGEKVFLWVGRLDANKDPLLVVKAFIAFIETNPQAKLYMIYQTFELLEEVKAIIGSTPGAGNSIFLIGKVRQPELQYWYNSADFIISTSHYEGSGVAICEAMSCGCIPVLTDIPSFRLMTNRAKIGLLYEAGNVDALLHALQGSVKLDQATEKKNVLERFKNEYSFEANARKTIAVINEIEDQR